VYHTAEEAVRATYLKPYQADTQWRQTWVAKRRSFVLEGRIWRGGRRVDQVLITDWEGFKMINAVHLPD
jgi:hypothetical protein